MATSSMIPHPYTGKNLGEGVAVPSDFRLPWNTTRSMAGVWAHDPRLDEHKPPKVRSAPESKEAAPPITPQGKIAFAGYDKSEAKIKRHR